MRNVSVTICLLISIWTIFATRSCDLNVPLSEWMELAGVRCQSLETWILSSLFASHSKVLPTAQNQCKSDLFGWISIFLGTQNYKCITRLHQTFPSVDYLPLCYLTAADAAATLQGNLFCRHAGCRTKTKIKFHLNCFGITPFLHQWVTWYYIKIQRIYFLFKGS